MNDPKQPNVRQPIYPRDSAGNFTVPATKGGSIQRMVGLDNFMEIFTEHETFRLQTPETIDPGRTNPEAMFVQTKSSDFGTSSPFVARTIIMAHEMLGNNSVLKGRSLATLMMQMHRVKETLLQCSQASDKFCESVDAEIEKLKETNGKRISGGRMLAYFPVVPEIDAKLTAFLIPARRVITEIGLVPGMFWQFKNQHSDPSHMLEKELLPLLGNDHKMVSWLRSRLSMLKCVIDFRNGQEHSANTKGAKLISKNFEMLPTNHISSPMWGLEGQDMTDTRTDLLGMLDFLLGYAEVMLVACIDANLPTFPPLRMLRVEKPPNECPVGYVLQVDELKLFEKFNSQQNPASSV